MLPFEFCIKGPPVSLQTRNRQRLQQWKQSVAEHANDARPAAAAISTENVKVEITYYYEGDTPDVDNIIKPIQDGLVGIIIEDDEQVSQTSARKRSLEGSYKIRGASGVILTAFAEGDEFLHVKVSLYEEDHEL